MQYKSIKLKTICTFMITEYIKVYGIYWKNW